MGNNRIHDAVALAAITMMPETRTAADNFLGRRSRTLPFFAISHLRFRASFGAWIIVNPDLLIAIETRS